MFKLKFNIEHFNLIFKIVYLLHIFFSLTVYGAGNKVTLVPTILLATILIFYRIFNFKIYINYKNVKLLLLLLFFYIISSVITIKYNNTIENIQCAIWMIMQFLLLYTFDINQKKNIYCKGI